MDKEQQIEEIANLIFDTLKKTFNATFKDVAKALYNAGYCKTFTSDFANDTQNVSELEAENKHLLKLIENEHFSYQTTTGKKYSIFNIVRKQFAFNTVRKQFAEELKKRSYCDNVFKDGKWHRYVFVDEIDELLKEYEK